MTSYSNFDIEMTKTEDGFTEENELLSLLQIYLSPPPNTFDEANSALKLHFNSFALMKSQVAEFETENEELNLRVQRIQNSSSKILDLFEEHDSLENCFVKAKLLKEELQEIELINAEFSEELDEGRENELEPEVLLNDLEILRQSHDELQKDLFAEQEVNEEVIARNIDLDTECKKVLERFNQEEIAFNKMKSNNAKLLTENSDFQRKLSETTNELDAVRRELEIRNNENTQIMTQSETNNELLENKLKETSSFITEKGKFCSDLTRFLQTSIDNSASFDLIFKKIETEVAECREEVSNFKEDSHRLQERVMHLEKELRDREEEIEQVDELKEAVCEKYSSSEDEFLEMMTSINDNINEMARLRLENEQLIGLKHNAENEVQELSIKLQQSEELEQELQKQHQELREEFIELEKRHQNLSLITSTQELDLERITEDNMVKSEELEENIENLRGKTIGYEELKEQHNKLLRDHEIIALRLETVDEQYSRQELVMEELREELELSRTEIKLYLEDKRLFVTVINEIGEKVFGMDSALEDMGKYYEHKVYKPAEFVEIATRNKAMEEEFEKLKEEHSKQTGRLSILTKMSADLTTMLHCTGDTDSITMAVHALVSDVEKFKQLNVGLEERSVTLTSELDERTFQYESLLENSNNLKEDHLKLEAELETVEEKLSGVNNRFCEVETLLTIKTEELAKLEDLEGEEELYLTETTQTAAISEQEIETLNLENDEITQKNGGLNQQIEDLTNQNNSLEENLQQIKVELNNRKAEKINFIIEVNSFLDISVVYNSDSSLLDLAKEINQALKEREFIVPNLEQEIISLKTYNCELVKRCEEQNYEIGHLQELHNKILLSLEMTKDASTDQIIEVIKSKLSENQVLNLSNTGIQEQCNKQEMSLRELWQELDRNETENTERTEEMSRLRAEYAEAERRNRSFEEEINELQSFLEAKEEEVELVKEEHKESEVGQTDVAKRVAELEFSLQEYERESTELRNRASKLNDDNESLIEQETEKDALILREKEQLNQLTNDKIIFITMANSEFRLESVFQSDALLEDIGKIIGAELCRKPGELNELECQLFALEKEIDQLETENDNFERINSEYREFEHTVSEKCELTGSTLTDKQNALEQLFITKQEQNRRNIALAEACRLNELEIKRLIQMSDDLERENTDLVDQNEKLQLEHTNTATTAGDLEQRLDEAFLILQQKEELLSKTESELARNEISMKTTSEQLAENQFSRKQSERELNALKEAYNRLENEMSDALNEIEQERALLAVERQALAEIRREKVEFIFAANAHFGLLDTFDQSTSLTDLGKVLENVLQQRPSELLTLEASSETQTKRVEELEIQIAKMSEQLMDLKYFRGETLELLGKQEMQSDEIALEFLAQVYSERAEGELSIKRLTDLSHTQQGEIEHLTTEFDSANQEYCTLEEEYARLKSEHATIFAQSKHLEEELDMAHGILTEKEEELLLQGTSLETSRITFAQTTRDAADIKLEYEEQLRFAKELDIDLQNMRNTLERLEMEADALRTTEMEERNLSGSLEEEKANFIIAINQNCTLSKAYSVNDSLEDIEKELTAKLRELPAMLPTLQSQIVQLQAEAKADTTTISEDNNTIIALKELKFDICKVLEIDEDSSSTLLIEILGRLYAEHSQFRKEAIGLGEMTAQEQTKLTQLGERLDECRDEITCQNNELEEVKEELALKTRDLEGLEISLDGSEAVLEQKTEELEEIRNEFVQERTLTSEFSRDVADAEMQHQTAEREAREVSLECEELTIRTEHLERSNDELRVQEDILREECKSLQDEKLEFVIRANESLELQHTYSNEDSLLLIVEDIAQELEIRRSGMPEMQRELSTEAEELNRTTAELEQEKLLLEQLDSFKREVCRIFKLANNGELIEQLTEIIADLERNRVENIAIAEKNAKQSITIAELQQYLDEAKQVNSQIFADLSSMKEQFVKAAKELENTQNELKAVAKELEAKEEEIAELKASTKEGMLNIVNVTQQLTATETALCESEKQAEFSASDAEELEGQVELLEDEIEEFKTQLSEARTILSNIVLEKTNFIIEINGHLRLNRVFQSSESLQEIGDTIISEVRRLPTMIPSLQAQVAELEERLSEETNNNTVKSEKIDYLTNFKAIVYEAMQINVQTDETTAVQLIKKCYDGRNILELEAEQLLTENKKFATLNDDLELKVKHSTDEMQETQEESKKLEIQLEQNENDLQSVESKLDQAYVTLEEQQESIQLTELDMTQEENRFNKSTVDLSHYQTSVKQLEQELSLKVEELEQLDEQFSEVKYIKEELADNLNKCKLQLKALSTEKMEFVISVNELELGKVFDTDDPLEEIVGILKMELHNNDSLLPRLEGTVKALQAENETLQEDSGRIAKDNKIYSEVIEQLKQQLHVTSHDELIQTALQLLNENQDLRSRDDESEKGIKSIRMRFEQLNDQFCQQEDELQTLRETVPSLKLYTVDLRDKLGIAEQTVEEIGKQLEQAKENIAELTANKIELQRESNVVEMRFAELNQLYSEEGSELAEEKEKNIEMTSSLAELEKNMQALEPQLSSVRKELSIVCRQKEEAIDIINLRLSLPKVYKYDASIFEIAETLVEEILGQKNAFPDLLESSMEFEEQTRQLTEQNENLAKEVSDLCELKQEVQHIMELGNIPVKSIIEELQLFKNQLDELLAEREQSEQEEELTNEHNAILHSKLHETEAAVEENTEETHRLRGQLEEIISDYNENKTRLDESQQALLLKEEELAHEKASRESYSSEAAQENQKVIAETHQLLKESEYEQLAAEPLISASTYENITSKSHDNSPFKANSNLEDLKTTTEELNLSNEISILKSEYDDLKHQIRELTAENARLDAQLMQFKTNSTTMGNSRDNREDETTTVLLNKLLELQEENVQLKGEAINSPEISRLNSEIEHLTQEIVAQEHDFAKARETLLEEIETEVAKVKSLTEKLGDRESQLHRFEQQRSDLETLAQPCAECENLRVQLALYKDDNDKMKNAQEALQTALKVAQSTVLDQESAKPENDERLILLEAELETCTATINDERHELTEQRRRLELSEKDQELLPHNLEGIEQEVGLITQENETLLTNMKRLADSISDADAFKSECFRQFGCFPDVSGACRRCYRTRAMLRDNETRDELVLKGRKCICIIGSSMYSFDLRVRKMREFVDILADVLM